MTPPCGEFFCGYICPVGFYKEIDLEQIGSHEEDSGSLEEEVSNDVEKRTALAKERPLTASKSLFSTQKGAYFRRLSIFSIILWRSSHLDGIKFRTPEIHVKTIHPNRGKERLN